MSQNSEPETLRAGRGLREHFTLGEIAPKEKARIGVTCRESRHRGKTTTQPELRGTMPRSCLLSPDPPTQQLAHPGHLDSGPAQIMEPAVLADLGKFHIKVFRS